MNDNKQKAMEYALLAFSELKAAGISEQYIPMLISVAQTHRGSFFGSFGSEKGCFFEIIVDDEQLSPAKLRFGIRRYKESLWTRIVEILKEGWRILQGHDSEYEIHLQPREVTQLKDLIRSVL